MVLGGSLLLITMIAIFGLNQFRILKTQLNEETLQAALTAKVEAIWPQLSDKLTTAAMSAVPAYRDEAMQRIQTLQPKLREMLIDEATAMADRLPQVRWLSITSLVIMGLILAAFFYLRFIASSITTYAEAPTLVEVVAAQVEPRLQEAPALPCCKRWRRTRIEPRFRASWRGVFPLIH